LKAVKNASSSSAKKTANRKVDAFQTKKPRRSFKRFALRFMFAFVVMIFLVPAVLLFLYRALNQVIEDAIDGEKTRGASTITMQLVKNLFLWPNRSFIRKGLEVPYAMMAELILPKKRIMEIYLNIAEWDKGIFGIELAAQKYFNRSAAKLGPRYSSLLAVTLRWARKKMLIAYSQTHPKYVYEPPTSSFQALAMVIYRYKRAFFMLNRSEYNGCT